MIKLILLIFAGCALNLSAVDMLIIRGAEGTDEFSKPLENAAAKWKENAEKARLTSVVVSGEHSKMEIDDLLSKSSKESLKPLWIIYLGHGTFLNGVAKLNLSGKDLSAPELSKMLKPFKREIIFINCASASAPFIPELSAENRIIITATKNSQQIYYTRFNEVMADAIAKEEADIDKDGQTSLFESFLYASREVQKFYDKDKRISGENGVLDDNGDKLGSLADMFEGLKPVKPEKKIDGFRAHQVHLLPSEEESKMSLELRAKRNALELQLNELKLQKSSMAQEEYYKKLEIILRKLAAIYEEDS